MKLFTKEIDKQLFAQYPKGGDLENQMVIAKIFNPYGNGVWYIINSDPDDPDYLWAIVDLFEVEAGSVSRMELETLKVPPFRLGLERDLYFQPKNALEVYEGLMRGQRFEEGGEVESEGGENKEMLENQAENIEHHVKELKDVIKKSDEIEPWIITKVQRAVTDLGDVTHYLEGENKTEYVEGGVIDWKDVYKGDSALVVAENILGLVIKPYGRKFHLRFPDGREKTYDASELKFIKSDDEYADGGRIKGQNNKSGETFGVVIGSIKKSDEYVQGGTEMNVRTSYSSRISEVKLVFDSDGNLYEIGDYGYALEGKYPDTSGGSFSSLKYDKKQTLDFLSKKYTLSFAKKLIEVAKGRKMAEGGQTNMLNEGDYVWNTVGKKLVVDKVTDDEYYLSGFMQVGSSPWSKSKIHKYIKKGEWSLKPKMASGGMMADGGVLNEKKGKVKSLEEAKKWVSDRINYDAVKQNKKNVWYFFRSNMKAPKYPYVIATYFNDPKLEENIFIEQGFADGGMMAKGGEIGFENSNLYLNGFGKDANGNSIVKVSFPNQRAFSIQTNGVLEFTHEKRSSKIKDLSESDISKIEKEVVEYLKEYGSKEQKERLKTYSKYASGGMMAQGGRVKFADKVKAVKKSLLERKKVPKVVQKDYGKTFSPAEAEDSAKRIVGAQTARERLQMRIKKSKK